MRPASGIPSTSKKNFKLKKRGGGGLYILFYVEEYDV